MSGISSSPSPAPSFAPPGGIATTLVDGVYDTSDMFEGREGAVSREGEAKLAPEPQPCDNCTENAAALHCINCPADLCPDCSAAEHKSRLRSHHKVVPLHQKPRKEPVCSEHGEKLKLFCLTCHAFICFMCEREVAHQTHTTRLVTQAEEEVRKEMNVAIAAALALRHRLDAELQRTAAIREAEEQGLAQANKSIEEEVGRLIAALEARRNTLLAAVEQNRPRVAQVAEQCKALAQCTSALDDACGSAQAAMDKQPPDLMAVVQAKKALEDKVVSSRNTAQTFFERPVSFCGTPTAFSTDLLSAINAHGTVGAPRPPQFSECKAHTTTLVVGWEARQAFVGHATYVLELARVTQPKEGAPRSVPSLPDGKFHLLDPKADQAGGGAAGGGGSSSAGAVIPAPAAGAATSTALTGTGVNGLVLDLNALSFNGSGSGEEKGDGDVYSEVYRGSEMKYFCKDLSPSSIYKLRVRVVDQRGTSGWSDEISICTLAVPSAFPESALLTWRMGEQLMEWYVGTEGVGGTAKSTWRLLYRGSRDGFEARRFHELCDNRGETMIVIRSDNGSIFGGFAPLTWAELDYPHYRWDSRTFIFSLINPTGVAPLKMTCTGPNHGMKYAMYARSSAGPTFGGGFDIYVSDNANSNQESYSNLGYSFALPGHKLGEEAAKTFLAGAHKFQVSEIEVFSRKV